MFVGKIKSVKENPDVEGLTLDVEPASYPEGDRIAVGFIDQSFPGDLIENAGELFEPIDGKPKLYSRHGLTVGKYSNELTAIHAPPDKSPVKALMTFFTAEENIKSHLQRVK